MAHAYTPGLKILREARVSKLRQLPMKGNVHVGVGAQVLPDQVVASTHIPGNVRMVNIANQLNIEAGDVPEYMVAKQGEHVEAGEVLAETGGLFGFFKSSATAPVDGTVESISSVTGQVLIRQAPIPVEVDAYIQGTVTHVFPEEGVKIEADAAFVQGIFGIGGERRGQLFVLEGDRKTTVDDKEINDHQAGKIIVGGAHLTLRAFRKAEEVGVAGIVVGGFDYGDLKRILGYALGVAITGSETIGTSLLITEGFGSIPMAGRTYDLLKSFSGKFVSINGATQIRAGVMRPEVIIPLDEEEVTGSRSELDTSTGMSVGSIVRVIREPYFGRLGQVVELPSQLETMESEAKVRIARVKLGRNEVHTIPRANLELVEMD